MLKIKINNPFNTVDNDNMGVEVADYHKQDKHELPLFDNKTYTTIRDCIF